MRGLLFLLLTFSAFSACGTSRPRPEPISEDAYPWQWRDAADLPGSFMWQQSIDAKFGSHTFHLDAVLQKKDDVITLVGLTPFGSKAFVLTQKGTDITFESFVDRKPPFPPKFMLIDVQRAYMPFAEPTYGGETITQTYDGQDLVERRFTRSDKKGAIVIRYSKSRVRIDNQWFGYTMDIQTTSAKDL